MTRLIEIKYMQEIGNAWFKTAVKIDKYEQIKAEGQGS